MTAPEMKSTESVPFPALLAAAAECVVIVDREGRIAWVNDRAGELFGYRRRELLGASVDLLVPEDRREAHAQYRAGYVRDPRNRPMGAGRDLCARRRDGSEFPVRISLTHAFVGGELLVMALVSDITALKDAERERERLREERIRRLEEKQALLERMARPPRATVTARFMGVVPLRESAPDVFRDLAREYREILDLALESRVYRAEYPISERLDALAGRLAFFRADPRDVVELHSAVLREEGDGSNARRVRGAVEEGHLLLVELMGDLAARYRRCAVDLREQGEV